MSKKHLTRARRPFLRTLLRREVGMTLMEVSISLLISGVGLLSLAQLFGVAASLNTNSRTNIMVARAAQEILENNIAVFK